MGAPTDLPSRLKFFPYALTSVQEKLGAWGDREFGNITKKVQKLQKNMERLRAASIGRGPNAEELSVAAQLQETLRQEEVWLKQRSRIDWLRKGDRNTKYYQAQAAKRSRTNRISSLERADGTTCDDPVEVQHEIMGFYQNLYQSQGFNDMSALL